MSELPRKRPMPERTQAEKDENPLAALERWNTRNYYLIKRLENIKVNKEKTVLPSEAYELTDRMEYEFGEILIDVAEKFAMLRGGADENGELHLSEDDLEKAMKVITSDYYVECRKRRSNI